MNRILGPPRHHILAWFTLFGTFAIVVIVIVANFLRQLPETKIGRAPATPTETATPAPTKFALAVASPTRTPTTPPTLTPIPTATSTRKPTATATLTRTPAIAPTKPPPSAAPATITPTPTATATPVSVGEKYSTLTVYSSPSDHSTALVELNIAARGVAIGKATLGHVSIDGPADAGAPQLYSLFADQRTPTLNSVYQINDWDWNCNCPGTPIADPEVTMAGFVVTPGEIIRVPRSSYYIGNDYQALVLYADSERITFNYTRAGNPVRGYTIYLEGVAVDSALVTLYQQTNAAGRAELPALQAGQGVGRARTSEMQVAIRDAGGFMDPRSRKDWWRGK